MLKLLLNHWHAHRQPAPFVLTDDPLYCTHFSSARQLPEVYSVNRVNPIFEEDDGQNSKQLHSVYHRRSLSEERREYETRSSDDTGYVSSQQKSHSALSNDVHIDDLYYLYRALSSDSDDNTEAVTVCADVHRVSRPDDIIAPSSSSSHSLRSRSTHSNSSDSYQEPYDSLTTSNLTISSSASNKRVTNQMKIGSGKSGNNQTEVKTPVTRSSMEVRERLQKLLEQGNRASTSTDSHSSGSDLNKKVSADAQTAQDIEKTKDALIQSLTRALDQKIQKIETSPSGDVFREGNSDASKITRSDSTTKLNYRTSIADSNNIDSNPPLKRSVSSTTGQDSDETVEYGITRQDESSSFTNSNSKAKKYHHKHRNYQNHHDHRREIKDHEIKSNANPNKCKFCDNKHKPLSLHQLLPGHWSHDNIYLPQIPGVCYHCLNYHHRHLNEIDSHHKLPRFSETDLIHPMYYQHNRSKARHSWAPPASIHSSSSSPRDVSKKIPSHVLRTKVLTEKEHRYSPDGSSHETETESGVETDKKISLSHGRSLRVPKKCKCEYCLAAALEGHDFLPLHFHSIPHGCTCCVPPHRRVKFASDTDLSKRDSDETVTTSNSETPKQYDHIKTSSDLVSSISRANSMSLEKAANSSETSVKKIPSTISRGQKEPIKVDELYKTYPMNFQEWEANYRRTYLKKRRKTALNMVGMAIVIILVVGVAIAMTFIFLRMKRPS